MTRTPPQHGERACYLRGCRRPECADAHYRYMSRYRLDREHGTTRRTDATPAAQHVQQLLAAGWNVRSIADAARCAHRTVSALAHGQYPTVNQAIADRILAITPGPPPPARDYVDATGTIRRIRALAAIGYSFVDIAAAVGINKTPVGNIARGQFTQVRPATATATAKAYRKLCRIPGTSQRARNYATKHGWHGPMAWDDTTIDDPNGLPEVDEAEQQDEKHNDLAKVIAAEIRHLGSFGTSAQEIARRVGRSESYVRQQLSGERGPGWRHNLQEAA